MRQEFPEDPPEDFIKIPRYQATPINNSFTTEVNISPKKIVYKYSEDQSIQELRNHIDSTYGAHYVGNDNIQTWDAWEALGACETSHRDTALKYLWRYGKKNGYNRGDLLKALHYIIILLHYNKKFHEKQDGKET